MQNHRNVSDGHESFTQQRGETSRVSDFFHAVGKKIGGVQGAIKSALLAALALGGGDDLVDVRAHNVDGVVDASVDAPEREVRDGMMLNDQAITHMTHSPFSLRFETARATFTHIYSAKPGSLFFIAPDGSIEKEVRVPKDILILQGSKKDGDREKFRQQYAAFVAKMRSSVFLEADLMSSGSKFRQVLVNSQMEVTPGVSRMKRAMELFEHALKQKTSHEQRDDIDTLWDVLDADGRKLFLEMAAGMFGVESGFDPSVEKGISQLMPKTAEQLGMKSEDVNDIEKAVPKTAEFFKKMYVTLARPGGPLDLIQSYGLPDSRFLVYAMFGAYHSGVGNIRNLCQNFRMRYPTVSSLPTDVKQHLNSAELYTFMTHRGDPGRRSYGTDSRNYVPQVAAMGSFLMKERPVLDKKVARR